MKIDWIEQGDEVKLLGGGADLAGKQGKLLKLSGKGARLEAIVEVSGASMSVSPLSLVRVKERVQHHHQELADGLHFLEWRGSENNCNTVVLEGEGGLVLIDPGHAHLAGSMMGAMGKAGLDPSTVKAVLLTHGHPDHIEGAEVYASAGASIGMHAKERQYLQGQGGLIYRFFGAEVPKMDFSIDLAPPTADVLGIALQVMHTPGHSPGSVCLLWKDRKALIVGDVVFPGGAFGRCDFPGGSYKILLESFGAFDGTAAEFLLSGHGPAVSGRADVSESIEASRRNLRSAVFSPW